MKSLNAVLIASCVAFIFACKTSSHTSSKNTLDKKSKEFYLFEKKPDKLYFTVLQLNDVYEIAPIHAGKVGGLARVETVKQELLAEDPNTITVVAGDFLNPSLLGTLKFEGERIKGKQMVDVMNAMNVDLVAFGNHEFDLKFEELQNRLNESNFEWVSANVLHNVNGRAHYFQKVKNGRKYPLNDSFVQEVYMKGKSLKVGFIGVCLPSNPRDYVTYGDIYREAERSYNEIKDRVDIVLGLTHLEIGQDIQLAKMLPNIPLIIGGHEHHNSYHEIGNVKIAKADANAKTVYIHRFEYDPLTGTSKLKSELRAIDDTIVEDPTVQTVVEKWQNVLNEKIREVVNDPYETIYKTKQPLDATDKPIRSKQTNMGHVIAKSMSFAYRDKVDGALVNSGSIRLDDFLVGKITPVDIFRTLPFGGAVYKIKLKGSLLKEVLEYGEQAAGSGAYLQRFKMQKRNSNWLINEQFIDLDKIYTIAISEYLMKGFDIPFLTANHTDVIEVYKPKPNEMAYDIRKSVISYLKKQ